MNWSESRRTGRLRLRHLREQNEAVAEDMDAERGRFDRLADQKSAPRVVTAFNLFQTPEGLAARLVEMLGEFESVLEPSAGLGRLYRAVRRRHPGSAVTLVEQSSECCSELYRQTEADPAARLVQGDFLACDVKKLGTFDAVVMNPPFRLGTDVRHIMHARKFLRPGGRLVAVCMNGPRQREKLRSLAAEWHELPPRSFTSEGTGVETAVVVFCGET